TEKGYVRVGQLAAITFTEKAAAEMRKRLRDTLTEEIKRLGAKIGLEGSSANMNEEAENVGDDKKLLAHLIRQRQALQTAYISTVHSFCARLLKENPLTARVDPAFAVIDEWEAAELLERSTKNVTLNRLRAGDKGTERLTLMLGFTAKGEGTQGLVETLIRLIPLARSAHKTPDGIAKFYDGLAEKLLAESGDAPKRLLSLIPSLLSEGGKTSIERKVGAELAGMRDENPDAPFSSIQTAIHLLKMAMKLDKGIGGRKNNSAEDHVVGKDAVKLMRLAAGAVLEREIKKDISALASLVAEVRREYDSAKEKLSALDFDDLEEKALDLLRHGGEPAKRRFARFQRVLVDEFQDTNELQLEIVTALARPGGLFIVGDMKQSIYGFRGTDFTVFQNLSEKITDDGGKAFQLRENRRSTPSLIKFTNGFFQHLMRHDNNGGAGFVFDPEIDGLLPMRPADGVGEIIRLSIASDGASAETRLLEAAELARLIKEKVKSGATVAERDGSSRPARYGDIALLLRKFGNLSVFENALRHAGVPYQVVKGKGFFNAQEVMDIISLLSFIDNQSDAFSLLCALRSPLAGLSDVTLYSLCRGESGEERNPVGIIIGDIPIPSEIHDEEKEKILLFIKRSQQWRKGRGRLSICELMETALAETGYQAVMMGRFQGEQKAANLQKLIDHARTYEKRAGASLAGFVSAIKKKQEKDRGGDAEAVVLGPGMDAVSIMTIHQSKGLEFPIVALADLGSSGNANLGRSFFHPRHGLAIQYYDEQSAEWVKGPVFLDIEKQIKEAGVEEEKRLLYVAMTRARDALILSGPAPGSKAAKGQFCKWVDEGIEKAGLETLNVTANEFPPSPGREAEIDMAKVAENIIAVAKDRLSAPKPASADSHVPFIHLTVTSLATFKKCPRLYYYRNALDLPQVSAERAFDREYDSGVSAMELGSRIHEMLEKTSFGDLANEARLADVIEKELSGFPAANRKAALRSLSAAFKAEPLSELPDVTTDNARREAQVAVRFSADDVTLFLEGAADIFWNGADGPRLVDYKIAAKPEDDTDNLFQLSLYSCAIMTAEGHDKLDAYVVYLSGAGQVTHLALTEGDLPAIRNSALELARDIARLNAKPEENWPVNTGKHCNAGGCFFKGRCRQSYFDPSVAGSPSG
ncbi:MAG: UvrD-helicase domain-containing protein, partial [Nitrospinae bacterium]|nr:UvrD-helicase domain-containing protein [Nitrospinota bacterium]